MILTAVPTIFAVQIEHRRMPYRGRHGYPRSKLYRLWRILTESRDHEGLNTHDTPTRLGESTSRLLPNGRSDFVGSGFELHRVSQAEKDSA